MELAMKFKKEKITKNTIRYEEDGSKHIQYVYIQKESLGNPPPEVIYVKVSSEPPK